MLGKRRAGSQLHSGFNQAAAPNGASGKTGLAVVLENPLAAGLPPLVGDFCNKIGTTRTFKARGGPSVLDRQADLVKLALQVSVVPAADMPPHWL
jgi:hypothetical protein